jgi:hypothetical protein
VDKSLLNLWDSGFCGQNEVSSTSSLNVSMLTNSRDIYYLVGIC